MKLKHLITTAVLTIAAAINPAAQAAFGYNSGDLYLGFRQVGNSASDFAVNIGAAGIFRDNNDPFAPTSVTLVNLSSTLDTIFNTTNGGWATDPNVKWSIFGTTQNVANNGDPIRVLYIGEPLDRTQPLQQNTQTGTAGNMINVVNYYSNGAATGNASNLTESNVNNGAIGSPGNANSVTSRIFTGQPFGTTNLAPGYGNITENLAFYRIPQGADQTTVTQEGTVGISGDTVTFTAIPEPSTYAFLIFGFAVVAYRIRRKVTA